MVYNVCSPIFLLYFHQVVIIKNHFLILCVCRARDQFHSCTFWQAALTHYMIISSTLKWLNYLKIIILHQKDQQPWYWTNQPIVATCIWTKRNERKSSCKFCYSMFTIYHCAIIFQWKILTKIKHPTCVSSIMFMSTCNRTDNSVNNNSNIIVEQNVGERQTTSSYAVSLILSTCL